MSGRISTVFHDQDCKKSADEIENLQNPMLGCSIRDLPEPILTKIILKLPIKGIVISKCVCKTWYRLISYPQFAKLHFARARAYPLIRTFSPTHVSRTFYLVEASELNVSHCSCDDLDYISKCEHHINMKLETKLKVPLRNPELLLNNEVVVPNGVGIKRKRCIKVKAKDHKFNMVNSCNGFICLSEPSKNEPVVVCNPVTGEFIDLPVPESEKVDENVQDIVDCGFGFCPKTKQYKVIRMSYQRTRERTSYPITGKRGYYLDRMAEIHTLGTGSWKKIGYAPWSSYKLAFPTYLKGAIHWFFVADHNSCLIVSFNFSDEKFHYFPLPRYHSMISFRYMSRLSLAVLKGSLCICDASIYNPIEIWVMKEYGVEKSWTKIISIDMSCGERLPVGMYQPIGFLKDGALLMFHYPSCSLIYYDPKRSEYKYFEIHGIKSKFEAIAHVPSFISLKDAVMGDGTTVQNIISR